MNYVKIRERKRANGRVYFFLDISRNGERRQEATGLYYALGGNNKRAMRPTGRGTAYRPGDRATERLFRLF